MKHLIISLCAVVALNFFVLPAHAAEINITDYYPMEPGKQWTYEIVVNAYGETETSTMVITTQECALLNDCVTEEVEYSDEEELQILHYRVINNEVYEFEKEGKNITQMKVLSYKAYEHVAGGKEKELSSIEGYEFLSKTCASEMENNYAFNGKSYTALKQSCTYYYEDLEDGSTLEMESQEYYVPKVGAVKMNVIFSVYGTELISSEIRLIDTNFLGKIVQNNPIPQEFSDVPKSHKNYAAIMGLKEIGVINGYSDGSFKPENTVNRAEMLKILFEGVNITPSATIFNNCFPDVGNEWFAPYICAAKELGWIQGYPDGTYKPGQTVNKAEALKMLLKAHEVEINETVSENPFSDVRVDQWFAPYVVKGKQLGILEETGEKYTPEEGMRRAGICENLYRLLLAK